MHLMIIIHFNYEHGYCIIWNENDTRGERNVTTQPYGSAACFSGNCLGHQLASFQNRLNLCPSAALRGYPYSHCGNHSDYSRTSQMEAA
ncbi:hypothetical protein D3C87_1703060 [compost metagenome]